MRNAILPALVIALLGLWPSSALGAPGDLDPSFGAGGTVISDFGLGREEYGVDVAVDAAGRTVVVGDSQTVSVDESSMAIARYTPSGEPDPTFGGGDGLVVVNLGPQTLDFGNATAVDLNGRILVAGTSCSDANYTECFGIVVVRLLNNGQPDPTFGGGDGIVAMQLGEDSQARRLVTDPSGRIIVMGEVDNNLAVLRFTSGGTLDPSFADDGIAIIDDSYGSGIGVDSQGRIDIAGNVSQAGNADYFAARFLDNGTLDPSFSGDGRVVTDIGSLEQQDAARGMAVDGQDRIVVVGESTPSFLTGPQHLAMVRYTASGSLDSTFGGGDGVVLEGDGSSAGPITIDANERLVLLGHISGHEGGLLRYQTDGSLDTSFGGGDGVAQTPSEVGSEAVTIDPSRRIVTAGHSSNGSDVDFGAARFLSGEPTPPSRTLSVSLSGSGSGSVTGPGINCPADCTESYATGTPVMLIASPNAGSSFAGWSGGCSGNGDCAVTVSADTTVTAAFNVQPSGGGSSGPSGTPTTSAPPTTALGKVTINGAKRIATFRFSGQGGAALTFQCKLDRGPLKPCRSPKTYRRLKPGLHVFRVRATDALGQTDTTPASKRFRIPKS